jgi:RND family efflux transporter MFP subunit
MSRHGLGLLAVLAGCGNHAEAAGDGADGPATTRVPVGIVTVSRDSVIETLSVSGRLVAPPGGAVLITAPAAGVVRSVAVQIGDRVRRGGRVMALDVPELAADAQQKAAAAAQAEREAERQRRLLADGITSARQAEEAAAGARQAAAAARAARDLFARTLMSSPIAGRVQQVLVQPGERVDAGAPLVQIVASDTLDLLASVPAAQLGRLRVGLPASIAQEGDSAAVAGRVRALAPGVDSLTNAGQVVIRVSNPRGRLHAGAGASALVQLGTRADAIVVPDSAIVLAGDSSTVFVVGPDSIAHQRVIVPGIHSGSRTEVREGVQAGERVVTTGAFGLQDGMRVVPAPPAEAGSRP